MDISVNTVLNAIGESVASARKALGIKESTPFRLLVGVSGGEDSCVLLHGLLELKESHGLELIVCHVDHGLRLESAEDAQFVSDLVAKLGLKFLFYQAPARNERENLEAWSREVRYGFFEKAVHETQAHFVLTAHHANDQAETVLFRFLTGRMARDAHAICACELERKLLRPLISVDKDTISRYSQACGLTYVHDSTNDDISRARNRIRHELLPLLEKHYNPNIVYSLAHVTARLGVDECYLWERALCCRKKKGVELFRSDLTDLPQALAWRVLALYAVEQLGADAGRLGYPALMRVLRFLKTGTRGEKRLDLGFGICCCLDLNAQVGFLELRDNCSRNEGSSDSERLLVPGVVVRGYIDGSSAVIQARTIDSQIERFERESVAEKTLLGDPLGIAYAYFDLNKLGEQELSVRERRNGDRMRVWKRGGRKVKKLLQERRLILTLRNRIPIVEIGNNIAWIPGVARSEMAPINADSRMILELQYRREPLSPEIATGPLVD